MRDPVLQNSSGGKRPDARQMPSHGTVLTSSSSVTHSALQVSLQARRFQRLHESAKSPLEGLPFCGCVQATHSAEVCPPARGGLRFVDHGLVRSIEHQPVQQPFGLLLSTAQTASLCLGPFGLRVHFNHVGLLLRLSYGEVDAGGATGAALAAATAASPAFRVSSSARLRCSSRR